MTPTNPTLWELATALRRTPDAAAETRAERLIRLALVALALSPLLSLF